MSILDLKVTLELEPEAGVVASVSLSSVEKGDANTVIDYRVVGKQTGKTLLGGKRLVVAANGETVSNEKNNPVNLVVPKNCASRIVDFQLLIQELLQAAADCGEIPSIITISPGV